MNNPSENRLRYIGERKQDIKAREQHNYQLFRFHVNYFTICVLKACENKIFSSCLQQLLEQLDQPFYDLLELHLTIHLLQILQFSLIPSNFHGTHMSYPIKIRHNHVNAHQKLIYRLITSSKHQDYITFSDQSTNPQFNDDHFANQFQQLISQCACIMLISSREILVMVWNLIQVHGCCNDNVQKQESPSIVYVMYQSSHSQERRKIVIVPRMQTKVNQSYLML